MQFQILRIKHLLTRQGPHLTSENKWVGELLHALKKKHGITLFGQLNPWTNYIHRIKNLNAINANSYLLNKTTLTPTLRNYFSMPWKNTRSLI